MSPQVMAVLPLVLFAPWFAILGALFWLYPRAPRDAARRRFDACALLAALVGFFVVMRVVMEGADRSRGGLWPQVVSSSAAYGVFLAILALAFVVRHLWLRSRR